MHHTISIQDEFKMQDKPGNTEAAEPVKKEYEVISESGLYKSGKHYTKGETILLIEKAAASFIAAGDIKTI